MTPRASIHRWRWNLDDRGEKIDMPILEVLTRDSGALLAEVEWDWSIDEAKAYVFPSLDIAERVLAQIVAKSKWSTWLVVVPSDRETAPVAFVKNEVPEVPARARKGSRGRESFGAHVADAMEEREQ